MSRESKAHFGLPEYAPWTIAVNVTWMERGFNAGQTHRNEILVGDCHFSYPLHLSPPLGCSRWGVPIGILGKRLVLRKLESWGYQAVKTV